MSLLFGVADNANVFLQDISGNAFEKYLSDVLTKYFEDNHRAEEICQFILENRESQVKENIKLKKDKK